jgi:hypothetical protein
MRCEWALRTRCIVLVVLMGMLLGLGMGAAKAPDQGTPPGLRRLEEDMKTGGPLIIVNYQMADLSLAVREQVDFLLTPALLVQEAVSDDVILTYPEE